MFTKDNDSCSIFLLFDVNRNFLELNILVFFWKCCAVAAIGSGGGGEGEGDTSPYPDL